MQNRSVPTAFCTLVESHGGFLLERTPPRDVSGWILEQEFRSGSDPTINFSAQFLFIDAMQAERFGTLLLKEFQGAKFEEWQLGTGSLNKTSDLYECAFCHMQPPMMADRLFRNVVGPSICDRCLSKFWEQSNSNPKK